MRSIRQVRDLGAERTLALAAATADDFAGAEWRLVDYEWLDFDPEGDSEIELSFESLSPGAVPPKERHSSGLALEHPGRDAFVWTVLVWLLLVGGAMVLLLARL
jgi:hypothetical protein